MTNSQTPALPPIPDAAEVLALRELAEQVAREVGSLAATLRAQAVEVAATKSSVVDVVTKADLAAEELAQRLLSEARPHDGLLGEEGGLRTGQSGLTWVVDPIDGTVNYLYGRPEYAVSVAVVMGDPEDVTTWRPLAGCVHAPALGVTYRAGIGLGSQRNGEDLRLAAAAPLDQSLVGTGFSYLAEARGRQAEVLTRVLPRVRDIRRAGAGALDVCDVAGGRLDAHFEVGLNPWDIAAAELVVTESGGVVRHSPREADGRRLSVYAHPDRLAELTALLTAEAGAAASMD